MWFSSFIQRWRSTETAQNTGINIFSSHKQTCSLYQLVKFRMTFGKGADIKDWDVLSGDVSIRHPLLGQNLLVLLSCSAVTEENCFVQDRPVVWFGYAEHFVHRPPQQQWPKIKYNFVSLTSPLVLHRETFIILNPSLMACNFSLQNLSSCLLLLGRK